MVDIYSALKWVIFSATLIEKSFMKAHEIADSIDWGGGTITVYCMTIYTEDMLYRYLWFNVIMQFQKILQLYTITLT